LKDDSLGRKFYALKLSHPHYLESKVKLLAVGLIIAPEWTRRLNRSMMQSRSTDRILPRPRNSSKEQQCRLPCRRHHPVAEEEAAVGIAFGPAADSSLQVAGRHKPVADIEGNPEEVAGLVGNTVEQTLLPIASPGCSRTQ